MPLKHENGKIVAILNPDSVPEVPHYDILLSHNTLTSIPKCCLCCQKPNFESILKCD